MFSKTGDIHWPLNSPDLMPMNFSLMGLLQIEGVQQCSKDFVSVKSKNTRETFR